MLQFSLNQKTLSHLGFAGFLAMAAKVNCVGVEPRDDLGRPFFDGIKPSEAGRMAREQGLRFIGLSQVYPFNDWSDARRSAVLRLIETAYEAGAETITLVPRVDQRAGSDIERATTLRLVLEQIVPILRGTAIVALIEPIGFTTSSIRTQREATEVIESMQADGRLGIIHDTFQHALAKDHDIMIPQIRLVHISGVTCGETGLTETHDASRGLIDGNDRSDACGQIKALLNFKYEGAFSFECTSPWMQSLHDIPAKIAESICYIQRWVDDIEQV